MKIINLTPHAINLITGDTTITIEPSGTVARVAAKTVKIGMMDCDGVEIPVTTTEYGEIENLPEEKPETIYIVSAMVAKLCVHRFDVFVPNESVRDDNGRIIGCRSLGRIY